MKKIVLMLMVMVVFGNVLGATATWFDKKVRNVAFQTVPDAADRLIIYTEDKYSWAYYFSDDFSLSKAKTFMAIAMFAQTNGKNIRIRYNSDDIPGEGAYARIETIFVCD